MIWFDKLFNYFFILFGVSLTSADFPPTLLETEYGPIQGYIRTGDSGVQYVSYRGVPFAKQPVGELRFKPLEAPDNWTETFDAKDEGPVCPQNPGIYGTLMNPQGMSESCIHVNVHVPLKSEASSLPVLVFIHGGSFIYGSGDSDIYGPEFLVSKNIILVTFNYRLDALGFLYLNTSDAPGNQGLKDMVFLLEWVQRNIAAFGGDPNNVTIGGQSAGAAAAHLLTISPLAKGLFNKAIMESGSGLASYLNLSPTFAISITQSLATIMGLNTTDESKIFKALKNATYQDILTGTAQLSNNFGTVIETKYDGVEAFMTKSPLDYITSGEASDVSQLLGFNNGEAGTYVKFAAALNVMPSVAAYPTIMVPIDISNVANQTIINKAADIIVERYFGNVSNINNSTVYNFVLQLSDNQDKYPAIKQIRHNLKYLKSASYLYEFSFVSKNNLVKYVISGANYPGAVHGDELCYLFKTDSQNVTFDVGSAAETTKYRMLELWSNFIKYGNPTPATSENITVLWPATDSDFTYYSINNTLSIGTNLISDIVKFEDSLYNLIDAN